jgi:hypothetical protein
MSGKKTRKLLSERASSRVHGARTPQKKTGKKKQKMLREKPRAGADLEA